MEKLNESNKSSMKGSKANLSVNQNREGEMGAGP